jgi:hypothetical protein
MDRISFEGIVRFLFNEFLGRVKCKKYYLVFIQYNNQKVRIIKKK